MKNKNAWWMIALALILSLGLIEPQKVEAKGDIPKAEVKGDIPIIPCKQVDFDGFYVEYLEVGVSDEFEVKATYCETHLQLYFNGVYCALAAPKGTDTNGVVHYEIALSRCQYAQLH